MNQFIRIFMSLTALCLISISAQAQEKIDVATAFEKAEAGEVLLLDIRTPREWKSTGVAPQATPLNMRSSSFGSELMSLIGSNRDQPIALICATGGRSGYLAEVMAEAGFTAVFDVTEGMVGSDVGPGWIEAGLPVAPFSPRN